MQTIYDIIGIGIGPFNLGLAALSSEIPELKTLFLDQKDCFSWHEGMMIEGTRLQVPFHADLVTLANPQSHFSFMSHLKAKGRLFRFTIGEEYFPLRTEYNAYCKWVAGRLENLQFNADCRQIAYDNRYKLYTVSVTNRKSGEKEIYYAKNIVVGVGTAPWTPHDGHSKNENIFHSSDYLHKKHLLKNKNCITVVGSGQSAAEIFSNLLEPCFYQGKKLCWFTRSNRFFPMDYSKFALEMTSPDYINYFFDLKESVKEKVLKSQSSLYKGMNSGLIDSLYKRLYILSLEESFRERILLQAGTKLLKIEDLGQEITCTFKQSETKRTFKHSTDALILATGYKSVVPKCLLPIKDRICWDKVGRYAVKKNYSIDQENTIFVQNAELHTHGFNAPDLGMGPYRNAVILNTILGYPHYKIEKEVPFQRFC